jgi:2-oxoglutarate dehydrogenase E1 component
MTRPQHIDWIRERVEKISEENTKEEKLDLLDRLLESSIFSEFCDKKFNTKKRFGIEGLDASISGLGKLKI